MKIVCLERALLPDHDRPRAHIALILSAAARQRRLSRGRCRGRMAEGGLGSPTRGNNAASTFKRVADHWLT